MKRISHYQALQRDPDTPHVVTIGNFDGVHIGHQALLAEARKQADGWGLSLAVVTFEPHPVEVLNPGLKELRLITPDRKSALLARCGVDLALFQKFDVGFAALDTETFAREVLFGALHSRLVYVGDNFRFGRARGGGIRTLSYIGRKLGFEVQSTPLIQQGDAPVSSSRIRLLLEEGRVREASALLGRPHEITGTVTPDQQMGQKMGFATINLKNVHVMYPKSGIYAAFCHVGERRVPAAVYIGDRPTLGAGFSIEAHLLDFSEELYEQQVTLEFIEWIRDDRAFDSTDALVAQINHDITQIREILNTLS